MSRLQPKQDWTKLMGGSKPETTNAQATDAYSPASMMALLTLDTGLSPPESERARTGRGNEHKEREKLVQSQQLDFHLILAKANASSNRKVAYPPFPHARVHDEDSRSQRYELTLLLPASSPETPSF